MTMLLETTGHQGISPYNVAIAASVLLALLVALVIVHGFGASRPHS